MGETTNLLYMTHHQLVEKNISFCRKYVCRAFTYILILYLQGIKK